MQRKYFSDAVFSPLFLEWFTVHLFLLFMYVQVELEFYEKHSVILIASRQGRDWVYLYPTHTETFSTWVFMGF